MATASTSSLADFASRGDNRIAALTKEEPATINMAAAPSPEANASFYDGSHKDLQHALDWMVEANSVAPKYWNVYTEARIRLKMKDYAGARTSAEQARQLALTASPPNQEYVQLSEAVAAKAQALTK